MLLDTWYIPEISAVYLPVAGDRLSVNEKAPVALLVFQVVTSTHALFEDWGAWQMEEFYIKYFISMVHTGQFSQSQIK